MKLSLHNFPAPREPSLNIPVFEARICRIGQRFAHNFPKLADQPLLQRVDQPGRARPVTPGLPVRVPLHILNVWTLKLQQAPDPNEQPDPEEPSTDYDFD